MAGTAAQSHSPHQPTAEANDALRRAYEERLAAGRPLPKSVRRSYELLIERSGSSRTTADQR